MTMQDESAETPLPVEIIFSCSVCQATLADISKGNPPVQGDGIDTARANTKLWLTDCCHVTCGRHLQGGGVPFHPPEERPQAACPVCTKTGDTRPKTLYAIRGYKEGLFDSKIPSNWFDTPPMRLDRSSKELDAMRFHYLALVEFGTKTLQKLRGIEATAGEQCQTLTEEKALLEKTNTQLESVKAQIAETVESQKELALWKEREGKIKHYLGVFTDVTRENEKLREQLMAMGYAVPRRTHTFLDQGNVRSSGTNANVEQQADRTSVSPAGSYPLEAARDPSPSFDLKRSQQQHFDSTLLTADQVGISRSRDKISSSRYKSRLATYQEQRERNEEQAGFLRRPPSEQSQQLMPPPPAPKIQALSGPRLPAPDLARNPSGSYAKVSSYERARSELDTPGRVRLSSRHVDSENYNSAPLLEKRSLENEGYEGLIESHVENEFPLDPGNRDLDDWASTDAHLANTGETLRFSYHESSIGTRRPAMRGPLEARSPTHASNWTHSTDVEGYHNTPLQRLSLDVVSDEMPLDSRDDRRHERIYGVRENRFDSDVENRPDRFPYDGEPQMFARTPHFVRKTDPSPTREGIILPNMSTPVRRTDAYSSRRPLLRRSILPTQSVASPFFNRVGAVAQATPLRLPERRKSTADPLFRNPTESFRFIPPSNGPSPAGKRRRNDESHAAQTNHQKRQNIFQGQRVEANLDSSPRAGYANMPVTPRDTRHLLQRSGSMAAPSSPKFGNLQHRKLFAQQIPPLLSSTPSMASNVFPMRSSVACRYSPGDNRVTGTASGASRPSKEWTRQSSSFGHNRIRTRQPAEELVSSSWGRRSVRR